jgi:histidinol-phosphate aminotransferase
MNPRDLMRADLCALEAFPPSPPLGEIARRLGRPVVKLDANENPYGPAPGVVEALAACDYARYPDPHCTVLRRRLGDYLGVDAAGIVCSAGGDEGLDHLLRLFLEVGDEVIDCTPSFVMYGLVTVYNHGRLVRVPRDAGFAVDVDAVERALTPRTRVIFVCSPNNPTGNSTPREDILRLLESGRVVVLDEAYAEFAGRTHVDLVASHPNLVVLRTMSKWAALAGLRLGYAVADPSVVEEMAKVSSPFHVGMAAQAAGTASLDQRDYLMANVRRVVAERERMFGLLTDLRQGRVYPSETSFVYWAVEGSAKALRDALLERGVLVRAFHDPLEALRISVGTPEETDILLAALEEVFTPQGG